MKKEIIINARTTEEAIAQGANMLGVESDAIQYEVLEEAKKGFLGVGATPAKVKLFTVMKPDEIALSLVQTLIKDMELDATAELRCDSEGGKVIDIKGEGAGILIGHHGDTLDALQYLVNLAAIRGDEDDSYARISVDVENYRAKREATLRSLAHRMANKALKYKRNVTLEPMNPYERRIIHSEVQNIAGVSTNSVGTDNNRKVVIFLIDESGNPMTDNKPARGDRMGMEQDNGADRGNNRRNRIRTDRRKPEKPQAPKPNISMDPEYANDVPEEGFVYVHANQNRPEKLKSVASYFGDEEENTPVIQTPQPVSNLAKLIGIYDDEPQNSDSEESKDENA